TGCAHSIRKEFMALDYLMSPVTQYALLAVGLGAASALFLTLKKELRVAEAVSLRRHRSLETALHSLGLQLEQARNALKEAEEEIALSAAPAGPVSGMNFTTRSQALRMLRRGQGPEHVAAALHIARGEVALLCKVHNILMEDPGRLTA
ncbi:MAG: hypothetical protein ACREMY_27020, partial [bacterium]